MNLPDAAEELRKLKEVLRQRAWAAADSVRSGERALELHEVASIKELSDLCDVLAESVPKPKKSRWLAPFLLILALACSSLLLFQRVSDTHVVVDATSTWMKFRLSDDHQLTAEPVQVTSFRASGIASLAGPSCGLTGPAPAGLTVVPSESGKSSSITFQPVSGGKGLSIMLEGSAKPSRTSLSFSDLPVAITLTIEGTVLLNGTPCKIDGISSLEMVLGRNGRFALDVVDPKAPLLVSLLPIDLIDFEKKEMWAGSAVGFTEASGLTGGTVFLDELPDREFKVRDGQRLVLGGVKGWLRTPRNNEKAFSVRYEGSITSASLGPPGLARDLKPSWLEFLQAQHGLSLLWGTAISLFGIAGAALQWWKERA